MYKKPPDWKKVLANPKELIELFSSKDMQALVKKAKSIYLTFSNWVYSSICRRKWEAR